MDVIVSHAAGTPPDDRISSSVLSRLIRDVWNPLEVKVILSVAALGGLSRPVKEANLLHNSDVRHGARGDGSDRSHLERTLEALEVVVARGLVFRLMDSNSERWLMLGTEDNLVWIRSHSSARIDERPTEPYGLVLERPSIFTMYEQNIGLMTPIIADRLVEAIETYPESWIIDAIGEAVSYNRRNWRYIHRILENWASEGRTDETNRGDSARNLNREKHLRGKYAHLFERDGLPDL